MLGESTTTQRGFEYIPFKDRNGLECSLQQSSAIGDEDTAYDHPGSSCIWLGIDNPAPQVMASIAHTVGVQTKETTGWVPFPIPDEVLLHTRMHLSRKQVVDLIAALQKWVDTGNL